MCILIERVETMMQWMKISMLNCDRMFFENNIESFSFAWSHVYLYYQIDKITYIIYKITIYTCTYWLNYYITKSTSQHTIPPTIIFNIFLDCRLKYKMFKSLSQNSSACKYYVNIIKYHPVGRNMKLHHNNLNNRYLGNHLHLSTRGMMRIPFQNTGTSKLDRRPSLEASKMASSGTRTRVWNHRWCSPEMQLYIRLQFLQDSEESWHRPPANNQWSTWLILQFVMKLCAI